MSEETVTPGNLIHAGEPLTPIRTGPCTWTTGNGITLTYRPNMIWAATAGPHTTIGATAQDALDSLTRHRRRTTGHEAALRRMSSGQLFARQMSRYLHIGPGSHRFRRPEGDLHKTIIRTATEATRPAEHGLHPEHIETAARPAIGALLAWERHITGRRADTRVLRHAHALGPRAVLGLLGDMVDAGVTTVDDGAAWFAEMSHSLAPHDPRPRMPGREHSPDAVDPHPTGANTSAVERPSLLDLSEADLRTVATIDADDVETIDHKAIDAALERLLKTHFPALRDRVIELEEALGAWDDEARERWIARQEAETAMRSIDFRNGFAMDLEPAREMVAQWVGAARAMLGDAPNYTETPVEMTVKVAESPERYAFILQRVAPGALTPHQAREAAETERDAALAEIECLRKASAHGQPG